MKKILLWLLCITAGIGGLTYFYFLSPMTMPLTEPANNKLTVQAIQLKPREISDSIEALGNTLANESVNITPNVSEIIAEIFFKDGEYVPKGKVLARLNQQQQLARQQVEITKLHEHQRELKRLGDLLKFNATAQNLYDERKTLLALAQHEIAINQAHLNDRTITAPFEGRVGLRNISAGALITPGETLTTIDDISQIKLDFTIPASFLSAVTENQPIRANTSAFPEQSFHGTISSIDSRVNAQTRSITVRAILPNPEQKIRPGMLMTVNLVKNTRQALTVPEEAIVALQDKHYLYLVDIAHDHQVIKRPIIIGTRFPGYVEVLSGVELGQWVIVHGISRVRPGQLVNLEEIAS